MRTIHRDDLKPSSLPFGAHVVEMIADREQCLLHDHFAGMVCLQLTNLRDFSRATSKAEPILVHCTSGVDCHLAGELLDHAGFEKVYRYEGDLRDLRPFGWRGPSAEQAL